MEIAKFWIGNNFDMEETNFRMEIKKIWHGNKKVLEWK